MSRTPRGLYPEIEPRREYRLRVSHLHELRVEESGAVRGTPVLVLHGGPGGGADPQERRFFDPRRYRIIALDQRGTGASTPRGEVVENTTWALVEDLERVRRALAIERWVVFGGSWGAALALAYAESYPDRVRALVLRGTFLGRQSELGWYWRKGRSEVHPDAWARFVAEIPPSERDDLVAAYHARLLCRDPSVRVAAARAWVAWVNLETEPLPERFARLLDTFLVEEATIQCHYVKAGLFLSPSTQLLDNAPRLANIPGIVIHGANDAVCPLANAVDLVRAWPAAELRIVPNGGHSAFDPAITEELVHAASAFA